MTGAELWTDSGSALYPTTAGRDVIVRDGAAATKITLTASSGSIAAGTAAPASRRVEAYDASNPQLRLSQAVGTYVDLQSDSNGNLYLQPAGGCASLGAAPNIAYRLYVEGASKTAIWGTSLGDGEAGVIGSSSHANGYGVLAEHSAGGMALYVSGKSTITDNMTVSAGKTVDGVDVSAHQHYTSGNTQQTAVSISGDAGGNTAALSGSITAATLTVTGTTDSWSSSGVHLGWIPIYAMDKVTQIGWLESTEHTHIFTAAGTGSHTHAHGLTVASHTHPVGTLAGANHLHWFGLTGSAPV